MGRDSKREALQFIEALRPYIQQMIREETKNSIKTAPGTVVSADNTNHTAVVTQIYSTMQMSLFNCTGKDLAAGDSVIIMWFGSQTNAWVGIKNDGQPWNV